MAAKEVAKDKYICTEGQTYDSIHIIANGSVNARFPGGNIILKKGDIVGLCDIGFDSHFFTYTTLENSAFISFPMKDKKHIGAIVKVNPEVGKMMYTSMLNQMMQIFEQYLTARERCLNGYSFIHSLYDDYIDICSRNNVIYRSLPAYEDLTEFTSESSIADWVIQYYSSIREFPPELKHSLSARVGFLTGFLVKASEDIHAAFSACTEMSDYLSTVHELLLQDSGLDLFDLYSSLLFKLKPGSPDAESVTSKIESIISMLSKDSTFNKSLLEARVNEYKQKVANLSSTAAQSSSPVAAKAEDLTNALNIILDYSGVDEEIANNFRMLISKYKKLSDKASSEDVARKLRLDITKDFYRIYTEAFQASVSDFDVPPVVKMFLNFGFVDAELAGMENANYLYSIINTFRGNEELGVFTAYEWLMAIYRMERDPSRNEFDVDYIESLREQRVAGKITADQEKRLADDPGERVLFELTNMFATVNKMTYGRITSFCPVLSEHDVIKPLQNSIVNAESIAASIQKLETIDYGAFYRETIFTDNSCGIQKEYVATRIIPDVILFPNIGTRGVMWQEIEGKKRTTHARFMVSVFHLEDIATTITRLTGEYRWEMCKRMQGARWNDVSERSLTSEYFDYIQFYKKNNELSSDAKEKIKNSLSKAKNSFKEMFVRDYITWIMFEGAGSPRLNKLVRGIMITYCPFHAPLRERISANPMFKDLIERYNIKTQQKLHHFDNVITKIKSTGKDVPDEILKHRQFIEGNV